MMSKAWKRIRIRIGIRQNGKLDPDRHQIDTEQQHWKFGRIPHLAGYFVFLFQSSEIAPFRSCFSIAFPVDLYI
jgi:hypothetical protein